MTLKDIERHNEMLNTVPGKLCLQNFIELNEHKQQQQLLHPLTKTCTRHRWFISKRHIPKISITVMTLKDIQHPNEILNTVHIKLCLQNLIDVNEHSTTAAAFTPFNKNLYQTVLIYFKKAYTENLHNCNDTERCSTSLWNPQHSACKALPKNVIMLNEHSTTASAFTPFNKNW